MIETWRVRFPITSFIQDVLQRKAAQSGRSSLSAPEHVLLVTTSLWSATVRSDLRIWFSNDPGDRVQEAIHALTALGAYRLASIVRAQADPIAVMRSDEYFECLGDLLIRCEDRLESLTAEYAARFVNGTEFQDPPVDARPNTVADPDGGDGLSLSDELDDLLENYRKLGDTLAERITASGIELRNFVMLGFLGESLTQTVEALAASVDLSLSTTRRCVDELAALGLVQTTPHDNPAQSTVLITAKGIRFLDRARQISTTDP
jgi:predicted transcriptional regulator